jgi:hypothetical protein
MTRSLTDNQTRITGKLVKLQARLKGHIVKYPNTMVVTLSANVFVPEEVIRHVLDGKFRNFIAADDENYQKLMSYLRRNP